LVAYRLHSAASRYRRLHRQDLDFFDSKRNENDLQLHSRPTNKLWSTHGTTWGHVSPHFLHV